ncbi:MAG: hypothetical protein IT286_01525 [Proteobacteria bacterium]|jgi:hypothetical protein|nr:hypothetical protein [Pseudomonadota bacterium]
MKTKYLVIALVVFTLAGCRTRTALNSGYNLNYSPYLTSPRYQTAVTQSTPVGNIEGRLISPYGWNNYYQYTSPYNCPTCYYPYYSYGYYNPYYYNYNYTYSRPGFYYYGALQAENSSLNFSVDTGFGSEKRNILGENLRAQTFGQRIEVEYGTEHEKLNLLKKEDGKTFVSGKILVEDELVRLNPKNQKCTSSMNSDTRVAEFKCTDGNVHIAAEVLIPQPSIDEPAIH